MNIKINKNKDYTSIELQESVCLVSKYKGLTDNSKREIDIDELIEIIANTIRKDTAAPVTIKVLEEK